MKKRIISVIIAFSLTVGFCLGMAGCGNGELAKYEKMLKNNKNLITLNIWTYYNLEQKIAFDELVNEFNEGEGYKNKIQATHKSYADVPSLAKALTAAANEDVGSEKFPEIFQSYSDDLLALDYKYNNVASLDNYFKKSELNNYVDGFLKEGRFSADKSLKIIPTAKATELLMINKTDWNKFITANPNISEKDLKTVEGITRVSEKYYEWSNGKAFFGRDSMANYMYVGAKSIGKELFTVSNGKATFNGDKATMKRLYDNFYVPYVKGYYYAKERYRSSDMQNGGLLAYIGSSASATFFPEDRTVKNEESYKIEPLVMELPIFEGGEKVTVQQGAGVAVAKNTELIEYASCVFIKWMTAKENSVNFTAKASYMPTTKDALDYDIIKKAWDDIAAEKPGAKLSKAVDDGLKVAIGMTKDYEMYAPTPFLGSYLARKILENSIQSNPQYKPSQIKDLVTATELKTKVDADIAGGMSRETALAKHLTEENFELWYATLKTALSAI